MDLNVNHDIKLEPGELREAIEDYVRKNMGKIVPAEARLEFTKMSQKSGDLYVRITWKESGYEKPMRQTRDLTNQGNEKYDRPA